MQHFRLRWTWSETFKYFFEKETKGHYFVSINKTMDYSHLWFFQADNTIVFVLEVEEMGRQSKGQSYPQVWHEQVINEGNTEFLLNFKNTQETEQSTTLQELFFTIWNNEECRFLSIETNLER